MCTYVMKAHSVRWYARKWHHVPCHAMQCHTTTMVYGVTRLSIQLCNPPSSLIHLSAPDAPNFHTLPNNTT